MSEEKYDESSSFKLNEETQLYIPQIKHALETLKKQKKNLENKLNSIRLETELSEVEIKKLEQKLESELERYKLKGVDDNIVVSSDEILNINSNSNSRTQNHALQESNSPESNFKFFDDEETEYF